MRFISTWKTLVRIRFSADLEGAPAQRSPLSSFKCHWLLQAAPSPLIKCFSVTPCSNMEQIKRNAHSGYIPQQTGIKVILHQNPFSKAVRMPVPAWKHKNQRYKGVCRQGVPRHGYLTADHQRRWLDQCTLIPAGRKTTATQPCAVRPPGDEPHLHLALFKAARLLLASAFCKPTEQSFRLALPWFNLGILLGSSLTLTPAGTACTSLKGKAGSEQSCGCRTQPGNCFSFLSSH